jgi:hypothetical protein
LPSVAPSAGEVSLLLFKLINNYGVGWFVLFWSDSGLGWVICVYAGVWVVLFCGWKVFYGFGG